MEIIKLVLSFVLFIIMDIMWFSYSFDKIYNPSVISIQGNTINLRPFSALFAWFLLALGINYFVLQNNLGKQEIVLRGALFGFIVYGVYNGTLHAIFSNYNMSVALSDLAWGTFATSLVSLTMTYFN